MFGIWHLTFNSVVANFTCSRAGKVQYLQKISFPLSPNQYPGHGTKKKETRDLTNVHEIPTKKKLDLKDKKKFTSHSSFLQGYQMKALILDKKHQLTKEEK